MLPLASSAKRSAGRAADVASVIAAKSFGTGSAVKLPKRGLRLEVWVEQEPSSRYRSSMQAIVPASGESAQRELRRRRGREAEVESTLLRAPEIDGVHVERSLRKGLAGRRATGPERRRPGIDGMLQRRRIAGVAAAAREDHGVDGCPATGREEQRDPQGFVREADRRFAEARRARVAHLGPNADLQRLTRNRPGCRDRALRGAKLFDLARDVVAARVCVSRRESEQQESCAHEERTVRDPGMHRGLQQS
jgi:hypothetical protein